MIAAVAQLIMLHTLAHNYGVCPLPAGVTRYLSSAGRTFAATTARVLMRILPFAFRGLRQNIIDTATQNWACCQLGCHVKISDMLTTQKLYIIHGLCITRILNNV